MSKKEEPVFLPPSGVVDLLGGAVKVATLKNYRREHKGPPFYKVEGAVVYDRQEVIDWVKKKGEL